MKIIFLLLLISGSLFAQTDKEIASSTITKEAITKHITYFSSDELKGRDTASEGIDMAADYIVDELKKYGAKPVGKSYLQNVPLQRVQPATTKSFAIAGNTYTKILPLSGNEAIYQGETVFLNYGSEEDFANADVSGKLVVLIAGSEPGQAPMQLFNEIENKLNRAQEKGAVGVVELAPLNEGVWGFIENNFNSEKIELADDSATPNFFYTWMLDTNGALATELSGTTTFETTLDISGSEVIPFSCNNVIAKVEGSDRKLKKEYVVYTAHYDHVGISTPDAKGDSIYNGARDNAVGMTTLLSMAENLTKNPTKRSALFVFFTAEEKGLLGSEYFINHPVVPIEDMVFCLNSDNGGYNDTSLITIFGLHRTNMGKHIETAAKAYGLTAIDDPAPEQNLFDRSDNVHFARKGVPAPTFSMGFTAFNQEILNHYHQPSDESDTLDFDYLYKFFQSYVYTGRLIGNDEEKPFWTAGDKYEEAGKELYNK